MATRQYIGARYVIKVYENSQSAGSAEWEANTSYEPLTMVTYQNSSYLSKKAVPATVGNPAENTNYWVVTGAYNGQIAQLQTEIESLKKYATNIIIPESYGAVGDGITNDYTALNSAIADCVGTDNVLFLSKEYYTSQPLVASDAINIDGDGWIIYDGSSCGLTLGSSTPSQFKNVKVRIKSSTPTSPTSNSIGVKLINATGCQFEITALGFEEGVICIGDDAGFANNTMMINYIYNCDKGLVLRPVGTGWVNSNTFIGGRIGTAGSFTGTNKIGISLNDTELNLVNNNVFENINLENCVKAIVLRKASINEFKMCRFEGVTQIVDEDSASILNIIETGYSSGDDTLTVQNIYSRALRAFESKLNIDLSGGVSNSDWFSCRGISDVSSGSIIPCATKCVAGNKVTIPTSRHLGAHLNVTSKYLLVECDTDAVYKVAVLPYNGTTPITGHLKVVYDTRARGYVDETTSSTIASLSFEITSEANYRRVIELPNNCDNVMVIIFATTDIEISSLQFSAPEPLGLITHGNSNNAVMPSIPTNVAGAGTVAYSYTPNASLKGWLSDGSSWLTL